MGKAKRGAMPSANKVKWHWESMWCRPLSLDRCWCCQRIAELQRAHIVAVFDGGGNEPSNLVLTCKRCNTWVDGVATAQGADAAVEWVAACVRNGSAKAPPIGPFLSIAELDEEGHLLADALWLAYLGRAEELLAIKRQTNTRSSQVAASAEEEAMALIRSLLADGLSMGEIVARLNAEGVPCKVPYGYRPAADGRTLEVDEGEAAVVGLVRELLAAGLPLCDVREALTERGFLLPR